MRELIVGIALIVVFFLLVFMLKGGYDKKKELEKKEGKNEKS